MKQILPIVLLLPFFIIYSGKVSARDTDQIGRELENINYSEIPYGVKMMNANIQITPTPGVTSVPLEGKTKLIEGHIVKEANLEPYVKEKQVDNNIFASILRGLGNFFTSIGDLFNFGNQKAVNWVGTMAPCGVADKALGTENPNCKNGKIVINDNGIDMIAENDDTKVLGIINTAPMDKSLDMAYCMQMPYDTGDCLKNNTPFSNFQPTNTSLTITPTVNKSP